jgi:hypothetical protein
MGMAAAMIIAFKQPLDLAAFLGAALTGEAGPLCVIFLLLVF